MLADKISKKIEKIKLEEFKAGRFSPFHSKTVQDYLARAAQAGSSQYEYAFNLINSWPKTNIPYNVGLSLDAFINREDLVVLMHKSNIGLDKEIPGIPKSEDLYSVMVNGLENHGHGNAAGGSAFNENGIPSLTETTFSLSSLAGYKNFICDYRGNDVTVIMMLPTTLVAKDGTVEPNKDSEVYDLDSGVPHVKPKFVVGALLRKDNGLDEFYLRDEIIQAHKKTM